VIDERDFFDRTIQRWELPEPPFERLLGRRDRKRRNRRIGATALALLITIAIIGSFLASFARSNRQPASPEPTPPLPAVITTVAGTGVRGSSGDGGPATDAQITYPVDLAADAQGNLYILEYGDFGRVRKVDGTGRITTVVNPPAGVTALAVDPRGNLYVGGGNGGVNMVVEVHPSGRVTTVAGTGPPGYSGDGGPATEATLNWVYDIAVDNEGNVFIADANNHRIREVDTSGVITTVAGTGTPGFAGDGGPAVDAEIRHPTGVDVDARGNIYIADSGNGRIRRVNRKGIITTVAGGGTREGDGVPATEARLFDPEHVSVDAMGNLWVEDTGNQRVRRVNMKGIITTIVGTGTRGFAGDGGSPRRAELSAPSGMTLAPGGVLYIADSGNNRIRKVVFNST
jgi:hypothetical protein